MGMENGLGAITVVGVEIPDGNAAGAEMVVGMESGDSDGVEVTETHRGGGGRVMAGRTHERKNRRAMCKRVIGGGERGGYGAAGVGGDVVEERRVGVEVAGLVETVQVGGAVGAEQGRVGNRRGWWWHAELPGGMGGAEMGDGAGDACGLFGAHRGAVIGALGVVKDNHGQNGRKKARKAQDSEG
jgi:hypothetical protein